MRNTKCDAYRVSNILFVDSYVWHYITVS